jgi:hypothetical protein
MTRRIREVVAGQLTLDYFMQRAAAGWTLAAVEWVRTSQETENEYRDNEGMAVSDAPARFQGEDVPYGFRIGENGLNLEDSPLEMAVLLLILEDIVKERRLADIALDLNAGGYITRRGGSWTPVEVFNLLPRVIDMGPRLLKTTEWHARRTHLTQFMQPERKQ